MQKNQTENFKENLKDLQNFVDTKINAYIKFNEKVYSKNFKLNREKEWLLISEKKKNKLSSSSGVRLDDHSY